MRIDRRRALALVGLGAAGQATAQALPRDTEVTGKGVFRHGVASGDPLADRVVIWTRASYLGPPDARPPIEVIYQVSLDPEFSQVVARGRVRTGAERDYTVKVDVGGLRPATEYFYRFQLDSEFSPTGRTRTLPVGPTRDVVLAVASCSLYPNGYFNAYRAIADLPRVDAVLHLGDYIYEYGGPASYGMNSPLAKARPHDPPHEIVTLADYRRRHSQYKLDPDSQAAHARAPWIVAWDDHETANDSFLNGAENHDPPKEGDWTARKAVALKAYYEWMPIREPKPGQGLAEASMRSFVFGDLASLVMIETRLTARDQQLNLERDLGGADGKPDVEGFRRKLNDPNRRMMDARQEAWIAGELTRSVKAGHVWQVLGNQVVMARVAPPTRAHLKPDEAAKLRPQAMRRLEQRERAAALKIPVALDMWDGYPADRERLYAMFKSAKARPIVLAGDSHSFWANELHDAGGARVGCEFGTTGITSPGAGEVAEGLDWGELIARASPEVRYNNQSVQGFLLMTLKRDEARADMIGVSTIVAKPFETRLVKSFVVKPEGAGVSRVSPA